MILIRLVQSPIELSDWSSTIDDPDTGAHAWFAGVTRRKTTTEGGRVRITKTLHYQAHESMALGQLQQLAEQAMRTYSLAAVVIVHRLGEVPLGQASVLVGCSSAHRRDAFSALPWIMDRLKADVPIWKRETFADDSTEWIHP
ncbi:molybdenum cofactor biosynthesis protein MoaE [Rhodopirellula sp. JC639]|uniref:molybdenum cofactor biosynthesis protein MoaE n=1 Tax=Stieleria mannarensis TaxID=2755585 RepID=UPI0016048CDF|nr:molybdenum cofactor biosynthesis protein MoaE [Rhodopirellula sp. JC639]